MGRDSRTGTTIGWMVCGLIVCKTAPAMRVERLAKAANIAVLCASHRFTMWTR